MGSSTCQLCRAYSRSVDDEASVELWRLWAYQHDGADQISDRLGASGSAMSARAVLEHFRDHQVLQPRPGRRINRELLIASIERARPHLRSIIDLVWRMRFVTAEMIAPLYYPPRRQRLSKNSEVVTDLLGLARHDFLYRWYPPKPLFGRPDGEPLWFLGRDSTPWVEARYQARVWPEHFTVRPDQIGTKLLTHDLMANMLIARMGELARGGEVSSRGARVRLDVPPVNWYGPRHMGLSFQDRLRGERRLVLPDGFASVSGSLVDPRPGWPSSWACPFYLEFDRGSRLIPDVVDQLLGYHALALSGAAGKRFPQLDIDEYSVPVIMVFEIASRVRKIGMRLREVLVSRGITRPAPIILVSRAELEAGGWQDPVAAYIGDPRPDRRWPLYELVERLSDPLIRSRRLAAHTALRIDPKGANRPRDTNPPRPAPQPALPAAGASAPEVSSPAPLGPAGDTEGAPGTRADRGSALIVSGEPTQAR
ncbi:replication-relaxation family protein [Miltoncostaea oceani]|uniref:replication-relaxation family protein n=1 Tax=Miltoncostaea oceani TaxID=2843216 RepID=UPI001C3E768B|nr:replication-relaxation family protein [Miltoncostaea oceani]